ncbi:starch-binding protein SusD precursor [mine drainage metagenome]|uniref:Starch-binding protein SusD n=1 Tax=mine drainage metagenome TaxID=410659 RepID=A0A1J5SJ16_9ZZZZ
MKRNILKIMIAAGIFTGSLSSCSKKLDLLPTNDITAAQVYSTSAGYTQAFAKVYGSFALTGNQGPAGNGDVQGIDEGTSDFVRLLWNAQELPTDEAVCAWGDPGVPDFHAMNWTASNTILLGLYYRSYYQITLCNDFINQASDANLSTRGITGASADSIKKYRAEARFLRAYQYSVLMDLFGNVPFVDETMPLGSVLPKQISRTSMFNYVTSELKAIDGSLFPPTQTPGSVTYGRATQGADWALLARLYLNAGVYTGTPKYDSAIIYSSKVIGAGYSLIPDYTKLFLADNNLNTSEFILTVNYDGLKTQNYGGTTFLTHSPVGGSMPAASFGIGGGWSGNRATKNLVNLFPDPNGTGDKRAEFYTSGQNLEINSIPTFTDGYAIAKFKNLTRSGALGQSLDFSDIDFPLFRLAEQYLIYAEAALNGGAGGSAAQALIYVNLLRARAQAAPLTSLTLQDVLNERGRELYWEGFRRTDLIRYNQFVEGTYLWPWKGGVQSGTSVASFRKLYPIPSADISSNTNLVQNPGY